MSEERRSYRIHNHLLPVGVIYPIIADTLNAYHREEDISNSPLIQWGRRVLEEGGWWHGVEKVLLVKRELALQKRQERVINLYLDMKNKGYNDSIISIFFDDDGDINVYDGFHRLSIMKYLGMEESVNCQISSRKSNFPLVELLTELNSGRNLYHPCDDERLKDFHVWRKDSPQRLKFILENIEGATILDIGCSEGYFSRELAKRGFQVTALDVGRKRLAVARHLSVINNVELNYYHGRWQDYMEDKDFGTILYLSVFHHDILSLGVEEAFKQLEKFRGRAKRVFFETPISAQKISWAQEDQKGLYDFTEEEFKDKIEDATDMFVTGTWQGIRPIFLLEGN